MTSFIITWNDASWPYEELRPFLQTQSQGNKARLNWRFAPLRMAKIGDEVFLLKQGKEPRGIFGIGKIVGEPFRDDDGVPYAPILFEVLIDPFKKMLVDAETLNGILEASVINHARSGISIPHDAAKELSKLIGLNRLAAFEDGVPDAAAFRGCFEKLISQGRLTNDERDMLIAHYNSDDKKITARQMSALMGWESQWANTAYGKLGRKVANQLEWHPPETRDDGSFIVAALITGAVEEGSFIWTLRPQIVAALEGIGWKQLKEGESSSHGGIDSITEKRKQVWQLAVERHSRAARFAKENRGYRCEACQMTFLEKYGPLGEDFIEAHHLYPLSKITVGEERCYSHEDFAVLCSNCHRMIHRWHDCADLKGFKAMLEGRRRLV